MPAIAAQPVTYGQDASLARFSIGKYQRMIDADVFDDDDQVELLEGYVVLKIPTNPPHDGTITRVQKTLYKHLPNGWELRTQLSLQLSDSQPEPDFVLARSDVNEYMTRHPTASDVGLAVEVANTSLVRDSKDKARIYAREKIIRYWIIDVPNRQIIIHSHPSGPTDSPSYSQVNIVRAPDSVPFILDGKQVALISVSELVR